MSFYFSQDITLIIAPYRKPLLGRPIVLDVFQDYILVTYSPFDGHIFHVTNSGELSPANSPVLRVCENLQSQFRRCYQILRVIDSSIL
jgi:hypothetical protein